MLDSFETRLTDMIADALENVAALQLVTRSRSDLATAAAEDDQVALVVHTLRAAPDVTMGDDARERRGAKGQYQLRTVLRLAGQVAIDAVIHPVGGGNLDARRRIVMQV